MYGNPNHNDDPSIPPPHVSTETLTCPTTAKMVAVAAVVQVFFFFHTLLTIIYV